jgi:tetratricopeptide (TPR) repeat protein
LTTDDFFLGRQGGNIVRKYVFADRHSERALILSRIDNVISRRYSQEALFDFRRTATNLTMVWGDGGMGKTALLVEIARKFALSSGAKQKKSLTYIDLGDYSNHDFETILIKIRASLSSIGKKWPAFDLAFANYWTKSHPGVDLMRFISHADFLDHDQREALLDQFSAILEVVLGGVGIVGASYKIFTSLRQKISDSLATRKLREACAPFTVLLDEQDPDKALGYFPSLLSFDLEQLRAQQDIQAICLLDTFEHVQLASRERESLEDLISRLIYLMPNMAFVSASRVRLDWAEARSEITLTYGGLERWPELVDAGGGQYQISGLQDDYADELLRDSLEMAGKPAIPADIRQRIVHGSYGLPLHLELSLSWFRDLVSQGQNPEISSVAKSFPELVLRIMRDLSPIERDLLRASALLEAFSEQLLATIVEHAGGSNIRRFLDRSFVERTPMSWLPYSLHDSLRNAVADHDQYTDGAWTAIEWKDRAIHATSWLETSILPVWDVDSDASIADDMGRRVVAALLLDVNAAVRHGIEPERLGELAFLTSQLGYSRVFETIPHFERNHAEMSPSLVSLVTAARLHANVEIAVDEKYRQLRPLVTFNRSSNYDQFVSSVFAPLADMLGEYEDAARAFGSIRTADAAYFANFGALGQAGNALRSGRLKTALLSASDNMRHPLQRASVLDLLGHIHLQGGDHSKAANLFEEALDHAKQSGSPLWVARALRHVAHARMWFDPDRVLEQISEATEVNDGLGEEIGVAQCQMASALAWAWKRDWEKCEDSLAACKAHSLDPLSIGHPGMIETLIALGQGDMERATRVSSHALNDLRAKFTQSRRPHVWLAVTALWMNRSDVNSFDSIEWYDSVERARERWLIPLKRMTEG